jgi:hypothetical protein
LSHLSNLVFRGWWVSFFAQGEKYLLYQIPKLTAATDTFCPWRRLAGFGAAREAPIDSTAVLPQARALTEGTEMRKAPAWVTGYNVMGLPTRKSENVAAREVLTSNACDLVFYHGRVSEKNGCTVF